MKQNSPWWSRETWLTRTLRKKRKKKKKRGGVVMGTRQGDERVYTHIICQKFPPNLKPQLWNTQNPSRSDEKHKTLCRTSSGIRKQFTAALTSTENNDTRGEGGWGWGLVQRDLVWWDQAGVCWLFHILAFINSINLEEEATTAVSVRARN